jgi:hypothetical protein
MHKKNRNYEYIEMAFLDNLDDFLHLMKNK